VKKILISGRARPFCDQWKLKVALIIEKWDCLLTVIMPALAGMRT